MSLATTDLQTLMYRKISTSEKLKILFDVSNGVKFLHDSGYVHLDLKPLNVLIFGKDKNRVAKITDFGLSLILEHNKEKYFPLELVTITHRAPEILKGNVIYSHKSDIWSLGIIFLEVLSGKQIFHNYSKSKVKSTIGYLFSPSVIDNTLERYLSHLPSKTKDNTKSLIKKMLNFNPNFRPTIDQVLLSPLFRDSGNVIIPVGKTIYRPPLRPRKCDIIYYYGFDFMLRVGLKLPIKLETFFLASDIYQRSLAYAHKLSGNFTKDWPNVSLLAITSLYMAIKMLEPYSADLEKLVAMARNVFTTDNIIKTEGALVQLFGGMIYPKNLFTETEGHKPLLYMFELLRNCHIYYRIDLNRWKQINGRSGDYNKYILLSDFIKKTKYYKLLIDHDQKYIQQLYRTDVK